MLRPHTGYLYKRPGSLNWWAKFQYPEGLGLPTKQVSLGTASRAEAEERVLPLIAEHKRILREARNRQRDAPVYLPGPGVFPQGRYVWPDGSITIGAGETIYFVDADGTHGEFPQESFGIETYDYDPKNPPPDAYGRALNRKRGEAPKAALKPKPDRDFDIIERWIKDNGITPRVAQDARDTLTLFKTLVGGKRLAECWRLDGVKLVDQMREQGLVWATVDKKIGFLRAACNLGIKLEMLNNNPFEKILPDKKKRKAESLRREPFSEHDMALVRDSMAKLKPDEQLLWRVLAATGMWRTEAFQINREFEEGGVRYVIIGTKTTQSIRRVPLPEPLLLFLPAQITAPLFGSANPVIVGKRLLRRLRELGISDEAKVVHSLRHRAKDQLRAIGCPLDIQYHLLGHEDETVATNYGRGYPVPVMKGWLDQVGL